MNDAQNEARAKREVLIERCRKLARMTTERGASEAEALAAASFLQRMVQEHGIAMSELEVRADAKNCVKDAYVCLRSSQPGWLQVCISIEKLYGTIVWVERSVEDVLGLGFEVESLSIVYYGFPVDVAGSIATLAICAQAVETELARLPRRAKKLERESFELGMSHRLRDRIREMRVRSMNDFAAASKGALVVLKEKLVKEEFDKMGVRLNQATTADRKLDPKSYAAGQAAANGVALDSRVGQTTGGRLK